MREHVEAGKARHLDVEENEVRTLPLQRAHGFAAVAALRHDLEFRRFVQSKGDPAPREQLVVDDRRADPHALALCGKRTGRGYRDSAARGAMLEVSVIDDGPGLGDVSRPATRRGGVGLNNARERLAVLYGDNYRFAVLNSRPGLRVEMALPFETTSREEAAPRAAESRYPRPVRLPQSASA